MKNFRFHLKTFAVLSESATVDSMSSVEVQWPCRSSMSVHKLLDDHKRCPNMIQNQKKIDKKSLYSEKKTCILPSLEGAVIYRNRRVHQAKYVRIKLLIKLLDGIDDIRVMRKSLGDSRDSTNSFFG